jgi:hypothetical protein
MKPQEQEAFVEAFAKNVATLPQDYVADFVRRHFLCEERDYDYEESVIFDSLLMWHDAIKWRLEQLKKGVEA